MWVQKPNFASFCSGHDLYVKFNYPVARQNYSLLATAHDCETAWTVWAISYPDFSNFLQSVFHENEGSGKDQFLGDPDWLSEMQYNTISPLFTDF